MDFLYDLENDGERYSFDSDGFDEESICSWISEPESLCNVWRGWSWKNTKQNSLNLRESSSCSGKVTSLIELSAKAVAAHIPFGHIDSYPEPIPEYLQLKIAFWSFPNREEDIRLYSCLANGSADEFIRGEQLYRNGYVKEALQIGFHLSGLVCPPQTSQATTNKEGHRTSVVFDRQRIIANNCTCVQSAWCQHIVALCLHRVHQAKHVKLRAPISETLGRLDRAQLQKFAQYLIHELQDQQILPTAQRLLDELLSTAPSTINTLDGAPDPTAGPDGDTHAAWYMDQRILHENIKKTLVKFCVPSPVVYSDLNCLSTSAPPAAAEWQSLLRPLRGREPEGIWNLLSIVRELFRRQDSNAVPLLEILTDEMLQCEQLLVWWFNTKVSSAHNSVNLSRSAGGNSNSAQNAASSLCDEIVTLWRLVALKPCLSPMQRDDLKSQLETWHIMTVDKVRTAKCNISSKKEDIELFPGFKPAYEATQLDWNDYDIAGVTYNESSYFNPTTVPGQTCLTHDTYTFECKSKISPVTNYQVDDSKYSYASGNGFRPPANRAAQAQASHDESSSSEGFCEQDVKVGDEGSGERDSESSDEGIKVHKDGYMAADDDSDVDVSAPPVSARQDAPLDDMNARGAAAAAPFNNKDLSLYVYDTSIRLELPSMNSKPDEPNYFAGIENWEDEKEVKFARAEALHAHGYAKEACELAAKLALNMLSEEEAGPLENPQKACRKKLSCSPTASHFSSTLLARAGFLCTVLLEDSDCHHLAFKIGMYGLEMHREPANSKVLEVKLANQEAELVSLLKRIPLGNAELNVIRERAEQLRDGTHRSRGEAHLPLMLTTFIFESLCLPVQVVGAGVNSPVNSGSRPPSRCIQVPFAKLPMDEQLGFEAAVNALGLKANISEAQHPLICEGTRRQKGDLAVAMMIHYKDDQLKLDKILEKLLDKEIHHLFKAPPISSYLSSSGKFGSSSSCARAAASVGRSAINEGVASAGVPNLTNDEPRGDDIVRPRVNSARPGYLEDMGLEDVEDRQANARLRCGLYGKTNKRPSVGMAAVDSSAPETTSSDNSPTVIRRPFAKHIGGGGSDSESSGRSSDSLGSGSSLPKQQRPKNGDSPSLRYLSQYNMEPRANINKLFRTTKGKPRVTPTEPNQPSEALAHFMFELAKTLLQKAGGSSSTSLFTQPRENNVHSGPHRLLHICAFQVGLYALGINNCVSKNWLSRTYSSHVSWINGQAIEIGSVAINILIDTWEGHLTPTEVASLTDRASRGRDPNMVRAAAELALSCLPHAQALNPQETRRALLQCKEQSNNMLEKACLAVEGAAKDGGVSPEVLFDVAKKWYELYEDCRSQEDIGTDTLDQQSLPQQQAVPCAVSQNQQQIMINSAPYNHPSSHMMNPSNVELASQPVPMAVCRNFQAPMGQMSQQFPVYGTYVSCYPQTQYTTAQGQPMPISTANYVTTVPFAYTQAFPVSQMAGPVQNGGNMFQLTAPTTSMYPGQSPLPVMVPMASGASNSNVGMQQSSLYHNPQQIAQTQNSEQYNYVMSAFRVGMLALETYGRRVSEDRPQLKYNRNPSCREDIKWLLTVAIKLGPTYLQQFCQNAVNSLFSPFILYDIATEVAYFQNNRNNQAQLQSVFRSPMLSSLMQRCLQMFMQCSHHRIHHIQPADYDEYVSIVTAARKAFSMVPSGMVQFQEMLQGLRRNKSCKKELWQRIMSGLSAVS